MRTTALTIEQRIEQIDALLPQTQCTQCGFAGCLPYATALVRGEAAINQCPPGGDANIHRLAALTGQPYQPLNPAHGSEQPRQLARIDEPHCIGCTLCIQACPVDAIVGAARQMHTVIASECTGCELCIAPCPVDCIVLYPAPPDAHEAAARQRADQARSRHRFREQRLQREREARAERLAARTARALAEQAAQPAGSPAIDKQALIRAAMARAAAQRAAAGSGPAATAGPDDSPDRPG